MNNKDSKLIYEAYTEKDALRKLHRELMNGGRFNITVFREIHNALGDYLFLTEFLPAVLSWLRYSNHDVDSLVNDLRSIFKAESMNETLEKIIYNSEEDFKGVLRDLKRNYKSEG